LECGPYEVLEKASLRGNRNTWYFCLVRDKPIDGIFERGLLRREGLNKLE
jgi:hypothetical protein